MSQERLSNPSQKFTPTKPLWTSDEIQQATQGDVRSSFEATNVLSDSREISGGELFVALKGPQFEGHDYVKAALEAGAAGALVDHLPAGLPGDAPVIIVPDVMVALTEMAAAARARSQAKIIGITGSFGKTSLKEALRHILEKEGYTLATERSFNNHWGVPLTLSKLHPEHDYAVIEMGMNNPGEISSHSQLVNPHIALITNTGNAHLGKMGDLESIAKAKAEIFEGLVEGGQAVLYSQDDAFKKHKAQLEGQGVPCVTFGSGADFSVTSELNERGLQVNLSHEGASLSLTLRIFSEHWARNCAALAAVLDSLDLPWLDLLKTLESFNFPSGRGNIIETKSGLTILDESYNAAPTTMAYALKSLSDMGRISGKRPIAILGDMLELGEESTRYHENLATVSGFATIEKIYCCGVHMKHLYDVLPASQKGGYAPEPKDLIPTVLAEATAGDVYLVKGSRGQWAARGRLSSFVDALQNHHFNSLKNEAL